MSNRSFIAQNEIVVQKMQYRCDYQDYQVTLFQANPNSHIMTMSLKVFFRFNIAFIFLFIGK